MKKILFFNLLVFTFIFSQTTTNPDISVIGDLLFDQDEDFSSSGVELAIQGYVNPFARADVYLHKLIGHESIGLEEAVITFERGLPFNLGLRAGKFRPDIGRINKEHAHTLFFISAPTSFKSLLGQEMWAGMGIELNYILPTHWYSKFSLGYFQEGISDHHHEEDDELHLEDNEIGIPPAMSMRLSHFLEISEFTHLEIGSSFYREISNEIEKQITGLDFKLKWRPNTYNSFIWQGEIFKKKTQENNNPLSEDGHDNGNALFAYSFVNYQFNKKWNAGIISDYSSDIDEMEYHSFGATIGYSPVEESSVFRILLSNFHHGNLSGLIISGQIVWSLGPHKPHQF